MPKSIDVLVTGATGQQGGVLARELLRRGHKVRAVTRNPRSPAAAKLSTLGASIHAGNFDDPSSLQKAARGADAAFIMTTPFEAGAETEARQGIQAIDAVSDVGHILLSSVASADQKTGIPHFDSKRRVEEHLEASGRDYTITAPAYFMENVVGPWMLGDLQKGRLVMAMPADRELQMIDLDDLGYINADVLERRSDYRAKRLDLATDSPTPQRLAAAISSAAGQPIKCVVQPVEPLKAENPDIGLMYEWFDRVGYSVDMDALRAQFPGAPWLSAEAWAQRQNWQVLAPVQR